MSKWTVMIGLLLLLPGLVTLGAEPIAVPEGDMPDHLVLCDPIDSSYWRVLINKLGRHAGWFENFGQMIYCPSFKAEFSVTVCADLGKEIPAQVHSYRLRLAGANHSIWYSMPGNGDELKLENLRITTKDVQIDQDFAVAIQRAWAAMLLKTRYPERGSDGIMDGAIALFSVDVKNAGVLYGETHSPQNGLTKKLVDLGGELVAYCNLKAEDRPGKEKEIE